MKLSHNKGFTILELIIAVALLGVVSVATGTYISDSFKDSNKLADKTEVQNSVTALMNKIETTIKEADVPVFNGAITNGESAKFKINGKDGIVTFALSNSKMTVNGSGSYENIASVTLDPKGVTGAFITIVGKDTGYTLTGEYYTQNMEEEIVTYTVNHKFADGGGSTTLVTRTGISGQKINLYNELTSMGEFQYSDFLSATVVTIDTKTNNETTYTYDRSNIAGVKIELQENLNIDITIEYKRKMVKVNFKLFEEDIIRKSVTIPYGANYSGYLPEWLEYQCYTIDRWENENKVNISGQKLINPQEHTITGIVTSYNHDIETTNATCTSNGESKCRFNCGYRKTINTLGHDYNGLKCTRCGICKCCGLNSCGCSGWCSIHNECKKCCSCEDNNGNNGGTPNTGTYQITFKVSKERGEDTLLIKKVTNGEKYDELPIPNVNDPYYEFKYWALDRGVKITSNTTVDLKSNVTAYAMYKCTCCSVFTTNYVCNCKTTSAPRITCTNCSKCIGPKSPGSGKPECPNGCTCDN